MCYLPLATSAECSSEYVIVCLSSGNTRGWSMLVRNFTKQFAMFLPKVLVTRKDVPQKALEQLREKCDVDMYEESSPIPREELKRRVLGKDALFCLLTEKIDSEILEAAGPQLKVIGTMSVGYDHLDLSAIKERGIKVGYTPGVLTDATAELTVALLLATSRRLFEAHQELLNGGWGKCAWSPLWMNGLGLAGSTVGIFGLGRIGTAVLRRLQGFGVKRFIYTSQSAKPKEMSLGAVHVSFDSLLKESDFVIITAALNEETKGIFNKDVFKKMKTSAVLVNTSRGGLINQEDLIVALNSGEIRAAGLDVMTPEPLPTDHPLTKITNCTVIPHIGSSEFKTREAMAVLTAENILACLEGQEMPARLC